MTLYVATGSGYRLEEELLRLVRPSCDCGREMTESDVASLNIKRTMDHKFGPQQFVSATLNLRCASCGYSFSLTLVPSDDPR